MKKLFTFKSKEREEKAPAQEKKSSEKELKMSAVKHEQSEPKPQELFWDDYSDVGYC